MEKIKIFFNFLGFLSFWIILIIISICKLFFNYFQNISWLLIFSPIIFSVFLLIVIFLFYILNKD